MLETTIPLRQRRDSMAERKYTHGLKLTIRANVTVLNIGTMEIWDGADLSLVRDTIYRLVREDDVLSLGVDVGCVQHVPSGFFGMLYDWYERGVDIYLFGPGERVQQMLWFRKFFSEEHADVYKLHDSDGINEDVSEELWKKGSDSKTDRLPVLTS